MNRKIITSIVVLLVLGAGVFVGMKAWQQHQVAEDIKNGPSQQEVLSTITRDKPALVYKHQPIIKIASIKRIQDVWYIVTIASLKNQDTEVPVKMLIHDDRTGSGERKLKTVLGPEAHFTNYQLFSITMPDSIRQELQK